MSYSIKRFVGGIVAVLPAVLVAAMSAGDAFREGAAQPQVVAIGRMPAPPVLDGRLEDWPVDATAVLLGQAADTVRRHVAWGGVRDLSGSIRLAWDDECLYLAADVSDDRLCQALTPGEVWQGDTLELFFNTYPGQQRVDGFWQVALVPPLTTSAKLATTCPQKEFRGVEGATILHPAGYTLECRLPWQNLTGFKPTAGAAVGFQIILDDRDGKGRKSQLAWYPSAITFAQPTHMNTLLLRDQGQTTLPRVLAGPNSWCVTDPRAVLISAIADLPGARTVAFAAIPPFPSPDARRPVPLTIPVDLVGERVSTGQATLDVSDCDGLYTFQTQAQDVQGRVLATGTTQAQLVGARYQAMRALAERLRTRLAEFESRTDLDAAGRAGLAEWLRRNTAFIANEARPESVHRSLLDGILGELTAIEQAATELEAGRDPYATQRGSLVRAYPSPLTGKFRPYALYVPPAYDPAAAAAPLIVLLHGIYADERQLALLQDAFKDLGAIVYQGAAYRQFDWGGISAAETWAGLADVQKRYHIDADRVYLAGYHIGGRGVWQLATARPDVWAAAAPIFAGIDTGPNYPALRLYPEFYALATDVRIPPPQFKPPAMPVPLTDPVERALFERASLVLAVENIAFLPLRSAYGEDRPDAAAERLALDRRLRELGVSVPTRYVPGAMHGSSPSEFQDPEFYRWLLAHRRPPVPPHVRFAVQNLRANVAWWGRVDGMLSPAAAGRIDATVADGTMTVTTANLSAFSLLPDVCPRVPGTALLLKVDGQPQDPVSLAREPGPVSLVRGDDGVWRRGTLPAGHKRHGLSGPIDDFQFDRFLFVYGTSGADTQANALLEKRGKAMADWGLGAVFEVKADREVTDADLRDSALVVIGTPATNTLLAKMADRLPIAWTATGLRIGEAAVDGPGAGACVICPNPLSPERYVVVVTATDEAGYQVWQARDPGGDYVLGRSVTREGKSEFQVAARGWFDPRWQWAAALCFRGSP